ncbi:hypothetical protein PPERSA_00971 [Pseudocohnilembus persalinus]|uniref:Large ribosomal subunit protein bL21m n=1 Tax=Pseudocohnilembus persalinus TaxID=266149 RepID=A0A0V0R8K6_PSEPJ|nr:hypothetical protein PPERSA_00971 [Pseudocohnilembus persalinus]|eukprot:KRX10801.1 hypothetical protein PPERSA_00971 [Pseudocohnilembus persalinus]
MHPYYRNIRRKWMIPLEKKKLRKERVQELREQTPEKLPEDEKFVVHNPVVGIEYPPKDDQIYAVLELLGKQYKVMQDDLLISDYIENYNINDSVVFDSVLLVGTPHYTSVGRPYVGTAKENGGFVLKKNKGHHRSKQPSLDIKSSINLGNVENEKQMIQILMNQINYTQNSDIQETDRNFDYKSEINTENSVFINKNIDIDRKMKQDSSKYIYQNKLKGNNLSSNQVINNQDFSENYLNTQSSFQSIEDHYSYMDNSKKLSHMLKKQIKEQIQHQQKSDRNNKNIENLQNEDQENQENNQKLQNQKFPIYGHKHKKSMSSNVIEQKNIYKNQYFDRNKYQFKNSSYSLNQKKSDQDIMISIQNQNNIQDSEQNEDQDQDLEQLIPYSQFQQKSFQYEQQQLLLKESEKQNKDCQYITDKQRVILTDISKNMVKQYQKEKNNLQENSSQYVTEGKNIQNNLKQKQCQQKKHGDKENMKYDVNIIHQLNDNNKCFKKEKSGQNDNQIEEYDYSQSKNNCRSQSRKSTMGQNSINYNTSNNNTNMINQQKIEQLINKYQKNSSYFNTAENTNKKDNQKYNKQYLKTEQQSKKENFLKFDKSENLDNFEFQEAIFFDESEKPQTNQMENKIQKNQLMSKNINSENQICLSEQLSPQNKPVNENFNSQIFKNQAAQRAQTQQTEENSYVNNLTLSTCQSAAKQDKQIKQLNDGKFEIEKENILPIFKLYQQNNENEKKVSFKQQDKDNQCIQYKGDYKNNQDSNNYDVFEENVDWNNFFNDEQQSGIDEKVKKCTFDNLKKGFDFSQKNPKNIKEYELYLKQQQKKQFLQEQLKKQKEFQEQQLPQKQAQVRNFKKKGISLVKFDQSQQQLQNFNDQTGKKVLQTYQSQKNLNQQQQPQNNEGYIEKQKAMITKNYKDNQQQLKQQNQQKEIVKQKTHFKSVEFKNNYINQNVQQQSQYLNLNFPNNSSYQSNNIRSNYVNQTSITQNQSTQQDTLNQTDYNNSIFNNYNYQSMDQDKSQSYLYIKPQEVSQQQNNFMKTSSGLSGDNIPVNPITTDKKESLTKRSFQNVDYLDSFRCTTYRGDKNEDKSVHFLSSFENNMEDSKIGNKYISIIMEEGQNHYDNQQFMNNDTYRSSNQTSKSCQQKQIQKNQNIHNEIKLNKNKEKKVLFNGQKGKSSRDYSILFTHINLENDQSQDITLEISDERDELNDSKYQNQILSPQHIDNQFSSMSGKRHVSFKNNQNQINIPLESNGDKAQKLKQNNNQYKNFNNLSLKSSVIQRSSVKKSVNFNTGIDFEYRNDNSRKNYESILQKQNQTENDFQGKKSARNIHSISVQITGKTQEDYINNSNSNAIILQNSKKQFANNNKINNFYKKENDEKQANKNFKNLQINNNIIYDDFSNLKPNTAIQLTENNRANQNNNNNYNSNKYVKKYKSFRIPNTTTSQNSYVNLEKLKMKEKPFFSKNW